MNRHISTLVRPRWWQRHRRLVVVFAVIAINALTGCALAWRIAADPAIVPDLVGRVRAIVGPGPVALVEGLAFQLTDAAHQFRYRATGSAAPVNWAAPAITVGGQTTISQGTRPAAPAAGVRSGSAPQPEVPQRLPATTNSTPGAPAWLPYVSMAGGAPVLERAIIAPDPTRPYVAAAAVRIDLGEAQLHLVAGTAEPASSVPAARPGHIPASAVKHLLAAFNGGFKAVNGRFGMEVNGVTLLPAQDGLATVALYRDGTVRLGVWGQDIQPTPDLVAFRQNCPLLVGRGQISALAQSDDAALWGQTVKNKIATWRSGLGLSADGRYLYYVAGDGLTVPSLAQALLMAGADRAMQLDINSFWTRFDTYTRTASGPVIATRLLDAMPSDAHQFLAADTRDFFYLTSR